MLKELYCSSCGKSTQGSGLHCLRCGRPLVIDEYYYRETIPPLGIQRQMVVVYLLKRFIPLFLLLFLSLLSLGVVLVHLKINQYEQTLSNSLNARQISLPDQGI